MAQVLMIDSRTPQEDIQAFKKITAEMQSGTADKIIWFSDMVNRITALEGTFQKLQRSVTSLEGSVNRLENTSRLSYNTLSENKKAFDNLQSFIKTDRAKTTADLKNILSFVQCKKEKPNEMENRNKKDIDADSSCEEPTEIV
jgi:hypothetical protein